MNNFSERQQKLLNLNDVDFLKTLILNYPEGNLLAGAAESSPEGNQTLKEDSITYEVFDKKIKVDPTAVEADRTFLGLNLLKAILNGDKERFPNLSNENFNKLTELTLSVVKTSEDLEVVLYSLVAQDLGKTEYLVNVHQEKFGEKAVDHDKLLGNLTAIMPELFVGFETLNKELKETYLAGLHADLNLGQFVQGENLPCNLQKMLNLNLRDRKIRLLTELYDFAGVTGHLNSKISIVMNNDNYKAFSAALKAFSVAIEALSFTDAKTAYRWYIKQRLLWVGLIEKDQELTKELLVIGRIVSMSRTFTKENGNKIKEVFESLSIEQQEKLKKEMSMTGINTKEKAILIYYAPAVLDSLIKNKKDFREAINIGLKAFYNIYRGVRINLEKGNSGTATVNVNNLAKYAKEQPDKIDTCFGIIEEVKNELYELEIR